MAETTKNLKHRKMEKLFTLLTFFAVFAGLAFAQTSSSGTTTTKKTTTAPISPATTPVATPVPPRRPPYTQVYTPRPMPTPRRAVSRRVLNTSGIPAEKSIAVDAKVNLELCVNQGNLKINGWNRNEVRAMVEEGSYVGFKVLNKNAENKPAYLKVLGYDPMKTVGADCLTGDNIEIDVPHGATVKIGGYGYGAEVSSIYKVNIKTDNGNIILNDIAQGITAQTYEGDLRVGDSGGEMMLNTTNGNIFAFNAKPIEFSNVFSARTNSGAIRLQSVEYPQTITKSTTGTIDFSGNILSGGQYDFYTQNGSILMNISQQSSCAVTATYVSGNFQSDIAMTNVVKSSGQPQKLTGQIGAGDASLKLSTVYGTINIKRKEP